MYRSAQDHALARQRFRQACDLSVRSVEAREEYFKPGSPMPASPAFCTDTDQ